MSDTDPALDPWAPARPPGQDELPYEDDEPMESDKHLDQMNLLIEVLRLHYADRPDVFVGGNMAVYYSMLQGGQDSFRAPDFFVVLDAIPRHERARKSWVVWEEGRGPDVVIEILSPRTAAVDRGRKKKIYAQGIRVPEYYLYDPATSLVEGYALVEGQYLPMAATEGGDLESKVLGLRLGVVRGPYSGTTGAWLRWKTAAGELLPTGVELAEAERGRADAERGRAEDAERAALLERERSDRLAARLRALGIDPDAP